MVQLAFLHQHEIYFSHPYNSVSFRWNSAIETTCGLSYVFAIFNSDDITKQQF